MKTPQVVEETRYGLYVWQMPNGSVVTDEERNYLCIAAEKGDLVKMATIRAAARSYGIEEGGPLFLAGHRKVTDEEFEEQKRRMEDGEIPDIYDSAALREELRRGK